MNELVKIFEFEGKPLTAVMYKGRPAFIAKEVGERLGYAKSGSRLVDNITGSWGSSFVDGKHYVVLRGDELRDFKQILELTTGSVGSRTPQLMLLFEVGIHKVMLKSGKPEAEKLQDFIADEVLPQLVRDHRYLPERTVNESGELVGGYELPGTFSEALRLLADEVDKNVSLREEVKSLVPYKEFSIAFGHATNSVLVGQFAQSIVVNGKRWGQNNMYKYLYYKEILISGGSRKRMPYQRYLDTGWFTVQTRVVGEDGKIRYTTRITPKGMDGIYRMLASEFGTVEMIESPASVQRKSIAGKRELSVLSGGKRLLHNQQELWKGQNK